MPQAQMNPEIRDAIEASFRKALVDVFVYGIVGSQEMKKIPRFPQTAENHRM